MFRCIHFVGKIRMLDDVVPTFIVPLYAIISRNKLKNLTRGLNALCRQVTRVIV